MKISTIVLFLLSILFASSTSAQVAGEWYGVGKVKKAGDHNSYLSEMIIRQKGRKVTGEFNYYFRSAEIKTKITGTFDPSYRVLELTAQPVLNFLAKDQNGADCPMEGSFTLKVTKSQTTLTGQFNPTYDYRVTCPPIDIKFVKSEPTASKNATVADDKEDEDTTAPPSEIKKPLAVNKTDTIKKPVTVNKPIVAGKIDSTRKPAIITKSDSAKKSVVIARPPIIHKPITNEQQISIALKERAFEASPIIEVDADSLKVSLYDNGEVDNDTISLFYNRTLVATKQMLSDKALTFTLPLANNNVNEISMFAENLGRIAPNTALAIIYAGEQRFELNLTSSFSQNATIRFRRKTKHVDPKNIN
ncbi:MAG: hypothetical protein JWQ09_570 [Segetibacter sp.]|nr:hypothetical protein [Segetibacter sp.]